MNKTFWSIHSHSRYSANDAMPSVAAMVDRAVDLGYPALGLTDHRTISGAVQLYKACRKKGIQPLPGIELNVAPDRERKDRRTYHLTVVAYSERGYRNLVHLNNLAQDNSYYIPLVDMADLAGMAEAGRLGGLAVSTGCFFGVLQQTMIHRGEADARRLVETLAGWFPKCYVELHNHDVTHDDGSTDAEMVDSLVALADEIGVPYVIAQDSHYLLPEDQHLHDGLKQLVSWSDDPSEAMFPGGPYSMVDRAFLQPLYEPHVLSTAVDNLWDLAQAARVVLPELENFSMKVPDVTVGGDPDAELHDRAHKALVARWSGESAAKKKVRKERLNAELDVIHTAGMSGYILLVADVCAYMDKHNIWFHARGSASGSVVCEVLRITQVDPLRFGLRMDRFMSTDRTRPPDIDLDVEHRRRDEVVAWLRERFSVRQVGSHMQYSLFEDEEEEGKGSLLVRYHSTSRKQGNEKADWKDLPSSTKVLLEKLGSMKLIGGSGTHAAGYIIAPDEASVAELPLTWMSKTKKYVTSYGKKDVEALGFLKMDLLGLRNLTAERITCEAIVKRLGSDLTPKQFWDQIPDNDPETLKRLGSGETTGIFQLEGYAMSKGCKDLKPRKLDDIIAAQTLFRPATRSSGATKAYIDCRTGQVKPVVRHDDIQSQTKETFGVMIYQEQLIGVFRQMGMPSDELTDMLDAVKASNEASEGAKVYLEQVKPRIRELAAAREWSDADVSWLLDALVGYAEYGFNKAHAASYGLVSYRTAYLLTHHPVEFWLGMLTAFDDHKKERMYQITARRKDRVMIAPAHVQESSVTYTLDATRNRIRMGLLSIPGIGPAAAAELVKNQPYKSLRDLGERCRPSSVKGSKSLALGMTPEECGSQIAILHEKQALTGLQ